MSRSSWVSLALRCALFAAAALALWLFSGAAWVPASLVLAAYGAILELAQARDADPLPPPHVCPSGFGDRSHEEVSAAILFADAEIAYLDLVGNYRGLFDNDPSRAKDGADFERRKAAEAKRSAQRAVLWAVTREREVAYRAVRSRMSGRKS